MTLPLKSVDRLLRIFGLCLVSYFIKGKPAILKIERAVGWKV